jgi:hypothetical protein
MMCRAICLEQIDRRFKWWLIGELVGLVRYGSAYSELPVWGHLNNAGELQEVLRGEGHGANERFAYTD